MNGMYSIIGLISVLYVVNSSFGEAPQFLPLIDRIMLILRSTLAPNSLGLLSCLILLPCSIMSSLRFPCPLRRVNIVQTVFAVLSFILQCIDQQ
ncbi:hypothetical protein BpHYR1_041071 [Brachionus plicatilis]|uniref:Uncharacterized protein n=1 Tax=Brachionus plicatilis TaxID=10195 RepID=A0A3M7QW50_BRAPC|nr:hypothetical protein BpHYR1_041071 [Brachionus plicatilis]